MSQSIRRQMCITLLVLAAVASAIPAAAQMDFYTLTPCRVYDSRSGAPLSQGTTYIVDVGGNCLVPENANAVALNVTIVGANGAGTIAVFPAGTDPDPLVGMLPFKAGRTQAVLQMVGLGTAAQQGNLSFNATIPSPPPSPTYHFVIDVFGYFLNNTVVGNDVATVAEDAAATAIDVLANDTDPDETLLIASATDPANGMVVLTGGSPGAHTGLTYQPDADYCNVPPGTVLDTFIYTVSTGSTGTIDVTVTCTNDAPVLTAGGGPTPTFTEGGAPVAVDGGIAVSDVDDTNLESAEVTITNLSDTGMEILAANTAGTSITANYVAPTLTLTGTDTLANYQQVLRSVTYENTSSNPNVTQRSIEFTVNDGDVDSNTIAAPVNVGATNNQPTITAIADQTIDEDTSTGALAFTVGDVETAAASLTVSGSSSDTSLIPNANIVFGGSGANRTVTVTPAANANGGPVTITVTVDDGSGAPNATATETFTVTITAVNDQPTVTAIADQTIDEDTSTGALAFTIGDVETAAASLTVNGSSSDTSLIPNANIVFGGSGASRTVTVTPAPNVSGGPVTITVTVDDGSGAPNATVVETFTVTITDVNDQPTISDVTDQTIDEDTSTGALAVTVGDFETAAASLTLSGSSSNPTLVPNGNIVFGGSGANRTVTVTPAANQFGSATITLTVNDGSGAPNATAVDTFVLTVNSVNDQPTVTAIADQVIDEDTSTGALAFTVGDIETAPGSLTVTGTSSNQALIPDANIVFGGSGANRTVTVTPLANVSGGPVTITVTVNDGSGAPNATVVETFTVTINDVNDQPTISDVGNQTIDEDTSTGALAFTVGDVETAAAALTLSGSSSNPTLIPNGNIVFGGSGANRTVTITPAANQFGSATITITVNDGSGAPNATASDTFTVTVNSVNDQPTVTAIADQVINEDTSTGALAFTVGDIETAAGSLAVSGTSSNTALIPNGNIVFGGSGANRTVTVTPAANQFGGPVTITVTVNDGSGAPNATVVETFTVTVNPVNDPPVADPDLFDYIGNTELRVDTGAVAAPHALETTPSTFGVVDGDSDPVEGNAIFVSAITFGGCTDLSAPFDCTDPAVGTVHMEANGRFFFVPAPGDTGGASTGCGPGALDKETFQYTLTDDGTPSPASTTGTVTLCRYGRVWYVDPTAGSGNGSSSSPLNTLTALNGAGGAGDSDTAGDYIFIYDGTLAGSIEMEASQHLIGQGHVAVDTPTDDYALSIPISLNGNPSPTNLVLAGAHPELTNASGDTVRVTTAIPVEIVGLSLAGGTIAGGGACGAPPFACNAIDLTSAGPLAGSSALTIANNEIRGAGAEGVDVNLNAGTTGTLTLNLTNNIWDLTGTHTGSAVDINRAAGTLNLDFSRNTNIVSAAVAGSAVNINGGAIANTTIIGFLDNTVHGNTAGNGILVSNATFDQAPGGSFDTVSAGTTSVGSVGNGVGKTGIALVGVAGDLSFSNLLVVADDGAGLQASGTAAYTGSAGFQVTLANSAATKTVTAIGGPALNLSTVSANLPSQTPVATQMRVTSMNSATTGVSLSSVTGVFAADTGSSITNAGTTDFVIDSTPAAVTYNGTITDDQGQLVAVSNSGGSLKSFTGAITDGDDGDGGGISLTGNNSTIRFSGGVVLSTGNNAAFTATGGGTVEVCDENPCNPGAAGASLNKITTTAGTALNVASTTIGANNLEFRSITAGTGAGSSGVGISLDNTGTAAGNGSLVVRGTGTAGSGGTIQHKTGANGSTTAGIGIYLNRTKAASFNRMQLNDFDNFAIRANEIVGLTLSDVVVSGINGNSAADDEGSVYFEDAGGAIGVSNTSVSGGFEDNLRVHYDNATAGPAAVYNVTASTFRDLQAAGNNSLVNLRSATSASSSWDVDFNFTSSCVFENDANTLPPGGTENFADGILVTFEGPFPHLLNVRNATFHHLFQGMDIASNFSADVDYQLKDNTITFTEGVAAIALGSGSSSTNQSFLTGVIQGNLIGTSGVAQSGNRLGLGIALDMRGEETAQFTVHGNVIRRTEVNGIQVIGQTAADGNLDIQITNNNIAEIEDNGGGGAGVIYGIEVTTNASTSHDICLDARSNDSFNINAQDIRVRQSNAAVTFAIEGLTGSGASDVNVENYLVSQNPGNTADVRTGGSIVNYTSVPSCNTPALLP